MSTNESGFTVVELLIALVVAVLLLGSGYQLYTTVLRDSGGTQRRANADNAAYQLLRQYQANIGATCSVSNATPAVPSTANLPGSTASVAISCPFGTSSSISLVRVTITYNNPETQSVSRAIYARQ
ncbi:MAG: prepilin-type N-terminal cleavage/methylation domain-containing protein [Candidatus Saccharimonas sp.]